MRIQELRLSWGPRDASQSNDARQFARFVSGLPDYDSMYKSWTKSPEAKDVAVPVPLTEAIAKEILVSRIGRYDDGRLWPEMGSRIRAGNAGPPPYISEESNIAVTECHVGAFGDHGFPNPNDITLRLSQVRPSTGRPWRASELRPLMKFTRDIWRPAEMFATYASYIFDAPTVPDATRFDGKRILHPIVGWITYLPPDLAARANVPADVHVETLHDGAALVTLCEEPFDKTDAEGMARLHALEAALRPIQS